ncbi:phosphatase PAP2 family protein [Streptomyces sp. NPDC088354]|uniref:phosphatase PAP2 family protein n=1 Tax=unclassified Streptomyces TaxID=2593676 RepID=UPI0029B3938B|nr:phosphatase PAP2 family protein [Streptomyces sp. MI02-7b]
MRTDDKLHRPVKPETAQALPRMSRTRGLLFGSTLVAYVAIVVAVLTTSKLVTLDWQVMMFRPYKQWPQIHAFLDYFVVLGQRGPTAVIVAVWLGWRGWRQRTLHPLLVLGTSLLLLNVTVGSVKYGLGRLGPHYATTAGSAELFAGGDIFPSGHTANAVVTWGVLAYLATTPWVRRVTSVIAALLALGVGMTTIYLGTHWVSDVLLGWAAGLLILLALPWFEPLMASSEQWIRTVWARRRGAAVLAATVRPASPAMAAPQVAEDSEADRDSLVVSGRTPNAAPGVPHHAARPHTTRHERSPVTPAGSRRPPAERAARPGPLGQSGAGRGRGTTG